MINNATSFLLLRLGIAISMFGHGLVRLPKLTGFSNWMVGLYAKSWLPEALVRPYSYLVPFAEFIIGVLLLAGLFTRFALIAGAVLMLTLLLGTTLVENWDALPSQLIHLAFFAFLLNYVSQYNQYSVDAGLNKTR